MIPDSVATILKEISGRGQNDKFYYNFYRILFILTKRSCRMIIRTSPRNNNKINRKTKKYRSNINFAQKCKFRIKRARIDNIELQCKPKYDRYPKNKFKSKNIYTGWVFWLHPIWVFFLVTSDLGVFVWLHLIEVFFWYTRL